MNKLPMQLTFFILKIHNLEMINSKIKRNQVVLLVKKWLFFVQKTSSWRHFGL